MEKIIVTSIIAVLLTGCSFLQPKLTEPAQTENTAYKKYDITMPDRPILHIENISPTWTDGEIARAYELDLLNMTEYALQLENILIPIAKGPETTEIKPLDEPVADEVKPKSWWNWLF